MNYDPKTHNISQLHEVTSAAVMVMLAMDVVEYEPKTYNTSQLHEVM